MGQSRVGNTVKLDGKRELFGIGQCILAEGAWWAFCSAQLLGQ